MKIEAVRIKGFRALGEVELTELDPKLNVFVGVNGAGKSSILDALHLLLRKFQHTVMDKKSRVSIADEDVTQGLRQTSLAVRARFQERLARWSIDRGGGEPWEAAESTEEDSLKDLVSQWKVSWVLPEPPANDPLPIAYPLIMHYPVTRAVLDIPLRVPQRKFGAWSAWLADDDYRGASFRTFFAWFRNQEDLENQLKGELGPDYRDPQLTAVRKAIGSLLPGYGNLRIQRSTPLRMLIQKHGHELSIQQLSDGEKCLLALVGDLARRLSMANPGAANPLDAPGIILIDELDLHLHPQWQIEVIPRLLQTFPNCQFFVSTHSPLLVSHAKPEQVFLLEARVLLDLFGEDLTLPRVQMNHPELNTYGQDMNLVVSTFMGAPVREPQTQKALQKIFATLADPEGWKDAKDLIQALRKSNPDLPDLVKAQAILERKELLAR